MRPRLAACLGLFTVLVPTALPAGELHPGLRERLAQAPAGATLPVILHLEAQLDLRPYTGRDAAGQLIRDLQALAAQSQAPLLAALADRGLAVGARPFWIDNCIALRATPAQIEALRALPGLARLDYDEPVVGEFALPAEGGRTPVWSQVIIRAPEVWSAHGLDGSGIVLGSMDTGVDIGHPALAGKWRGGDNSWLDLVNGQPSPYDDHGHGTHTIGTMVGGDGLGPFTTDIGTAPGAQFIAVKVLDEDNSFGSTSIVIAGAQWILDPDGDPDSDDFPQIVNNSWYFFSQTYDGYHATVAVWRAAGILPVFCLGNSGPNAATTHPPGNYDNTLGVGATTSSDLIWTFSSRGPAPAGWAFPADGRKPDLSAPGASVLSSLPGGGYTAWSGTSMAAPHVSATAALMLQGNADLGPAQLIGALNGSAADLGAAGYDHSFGYGRLDAYAAVTAAISPSAADPVSTAAPALSAHPNPFGERVRLDFALPQGQAARVGIYDLQGRLQRSLVAEAAAGNLLWDGRDSAGRALPAGLYLARLDGGKTGAVCRLLRLR